MNDQGEKTPRPNDKLVSVVIPCRNRGTLLEEAVTSLQAQLYENWEAVVIDDHSIEDVAGLVQTMSKQDQRIRLVKLEPGRRGAPAARNRGVEKSRGDYIVFLDSDDVLTNSCLKVRMSAIVADETLDFVVGGTGVFHTRVGDSDKVWNVIGGDEDLDRFLRADTPWQTAGPLWRRRSLELIGPWDENALDWQDWEYHIRALACGMRYKKLDSVDSYWRRPTAESISSCGTGINPERQTSRVELCVRIWKCLVSNEVMTYTRARALSTLSAHFIKEALHHRMIDLAIELERICHRGGIFTGWRRSAATLLKVALHSRVDTVRRAAVRGWCQLMIQDPRVLNSTTRWGSVSQ